MTDDRKYLIQLLRLSARFLEGRKNRATISPEAWRKMLSEAADEIEALDDALSRRGVA